MKSLLYIMLWVAMTLPTIATGQIVLLETYERYWSNYNPGDPEIGRMLQNVGHNRVAIRPDGNKVVRSESTNPSDGFLIHYAVTEILPTTTTNFLFMIEDGSVPVAANAFVQEWVLGPIGTNIALYWGNDHRVWIRIWYADGDRMFPTDFAWNFGTIYDVVVTIHGGSDAAFNLVINGTHILNGEPVGSPVTGLRSLAFACNFATTGSQWLDDIQVFADVVVGTEEVSWGNVKALYR